MIPDRLAALAEAWRDPAAYTGLTMAGPVEMPGDEAALVALDEVTVHAWDLAVATGQPYDPTRQPSRRAQSFVAAFDAPTDGEPVRARLSTYLTPRRRSTGCSAPPAATPLDARTPDGLTGR